jgi:hypothetical protein
MMTDNVEQDNAIYQYLKDGIVTEKIEWLDEDLDELCPALRAKECADTLNSSRKSVPSTESRISPARTTQ